MVASGSTSTSPPPLRRWATSKPPVPGSRPAPGPSGRSRWVLPRTTAVDVGSHTHTHGVGGSGGSRSWSSWAEPRRTSTTQGSATDDPTGDGDLVEALLVGNPPDAGPGRHREHPLARELEGLDDVVFDIAARRPEVGGQHAPRQRRHGERRRPAHPELEHAADPGRDPALEDEGVGVEGGDEPAEARRLEV